MSYGKYTASVKYELVPLTNNRVNVNFYIDEGSISRIKEINITGNLQFDQQDLLDILDLKTTIIYPGGIKTIGTQDNH